MSQIIQLHPRCRVKQTTVIHASFCVLIPLIAMLAGCATRPAPDFGGRWKAVNHFSVVVEEIPLHQTYVFYPSPMDGTLKNMLTRWAKDSKMALSYLHTSDFTLHAPVAQLRTSDLQVAVSQLTSAYAEQRISITASNSRIVVRQVESAQTTTTSDDGAGGATP